MIDDYLAELLGALHLPTTRRRRIVSEVEDHLASVAAELHAEGLDAEQAEREAISRFGPASELAHTFHEQEAARGGLRAAQATALLALVCAVVMVGAARQALFASTFPWGVLPFVLGQVALVAGGLTLVRAWSTEGGPHGWRLELVLRGSFVVLGCAAVGVVGAALHGSFAGRAGYWAALGCLTLAATLTAVTVARSRQKARVVPCTPEEPDILADIQGAAMVTLRRLGRRIPGARTLEAKIVRHAPRLTASIDVRHRPWRFALAVSSLAGLALAVGHGLAEGGLPTRHVLLALLGGTLLFVIEAGAALLGFALLGRYLGLRSGTGAASPEP